MNPWEGIPEADIDLLTRIVIGEAEGSGAVGQQAVASVIGNRMAQRGQGVPRWAQGREGVDIGGNRFLRIDERRPAPQAPQQFARFGPFAVPAEAARAAPQQAPAGEALPIPFANSTYAARPGATYSRSARPETPQGIIFHHTGDPRTSLEAAVSYGQQPDPGRGGSFGYHFYIGRDGSVMQGAPLSARTNHVRPPGDPTRQGMAGEGLSNSNAIGISLVGDGRNITPEQREAADRVAQAVRNRYGLGNVVFGHGEVQGNKQSTEGASMAALLRSDRTAPAGDMMDGLSQTPSRPLQPQTPPAETMMAFATTPRPRPNAGAAAIQRATAPRVASSSPAVASATPSRTDTITGGSAMNEQTAEKPVPATIGGLGGLGGFQPLAGGKFGDMLQMIGMALLSSPGNAPLQNLPALALTMQQSRTAAEERARRIANEEREFNFRREESQRAQGNTDRSFTLQQQQADLARRRADLEGNNITRDVDQRRKAAEGLGLRPGSPEFNAFVLTGSMPTAAANAPQQIAQVNQARETEAKRLGLREGTPEYQNYVLTGRFRDSPELSTTDRKAIMEAEDQIPIIQNTLSSLNRALELNPRAYSGTGAGMLGSIGTSGLPGVGMVLDPERAKATREFNQLMSGQAIEAMSQTLKGATTDREMAQFVEILGNPATPPEIRERTINRLKSLAERQLQLQQQRIQQLRGRDYYRPGGGQSNQQAPAQSQPAPAAAAPATPQGGPALPQVGEVRGGYRYKGGNPAEQSSWERAQ